MLIHRSRTSVALLFAVSAVQLSSNVVSDISYNEWSTTFPPNETSSAFTMVLLSAIFATLVMLPATLALSAVYCCRYADGGRFLSTLLLRRKLAFGLPLLAATVCDFLINVLGTYALGNVSLLTQVTMKALEPFLALALTVGLFRNERRRFIKEPRLQWLIPALMFVIVGTIIHFVPKFMNGTNVAATNGKAWWWDAVWFVRVLAAVGYNVGQCACVSAGGKAWRSVLLGLDARDEEDFDEDGEEDHELRDGLLDEAVRRDASSMVRARMRSLHSAQVSTVDHEVMAMQVVRMWTVALDLFIGMILIVAVVPSLDAAPTFSGHSHESLAIAWERFDQGTACVLRPWTLSGGGGNITTPTAASHTSNANSTMTAVPASDAAICSENYKYAIVTNVFWVIIYVTDVWMNHWSPAANSIVNVLGAPVAGLILLIHPDWDIGVVNPAQKLRTTENLCSTVGSVACILCGCLLFAEWEAIGKKRLEAEGREHPSSGTATPSRRGEHTSPERINTAPSFGRNAKMDEVTAYSVRDMDHDDEETVSRSSLAM